MIILLVNYSRELQVNETCKFFTSKGVKKLIINYFRIIFIYFIIMKNIFIVDTINNTIDYNNYEDVYILVNTKNEKIPKEFYDLNLSDEIFDNISKNLIIYKTNNNILSVKIHKLSSVIISKENLSRYNIFNYDLSDNNLVIPILDISFNNVINYLDQFKKNNLSLLKDIYNLLLINKHYNNNLQNNNKLLELINNPLFTNYWETIDDIDKLNKNTNNNVVVNYEDLNYLLKNSINNKVVEHVDKSMVYDIFINLNSSYRLLLFCNMLASNNYCHYVINNYKILDLMKDFLRDYKYYNLFQYIIGYTWLQLYIDELNGDLSNNMFDINTANMLPRFILNAKLNNPYISCLNTDEYLSASDPNYSHGINTLDNFKKYLNIYCTNNEHINIFENINFKDYNAVICGSTFCACVQNEPTLIELFNDRSINNYFSEYYANSDIDIMFLINHTEPDNFITDKTNIEFIDKVRKFYDNINNNICNLNKPDALFTHNKLSFNKHIKLYLTKEIIHEVFNIDITHSDYNHYFLLLNTEKNIEKALTYYNKIYNEKLKEVNKDDYINYPELFEEKVIIKVIVSETFSISMNFKYYIKSPYINHEFELFCLKNVNNNSFNEIISTFHLPCVRGYYDGENVFMTPSCVSAHLTNINIDYKDSHYDIDNIIAKYHMRGFGTIMSHSKKRKFKASRPNNMKSYYDGLFNYVILEKLFTNNIYKPRLYFPELFTECDYVETENRYKKYKPLKQVVNYSSDKYSSLNLNVILDHNICKFKRYIIDIYLLETNIDNQKKNNKKIPIDDNDSSDYSDSD